MPRILGVPVWALPVWVLPVWVLTVVSKQTVSTWQRWLLLMLVAGSPSASADESPAEKAPVGTTVQLPTFGVAIDADGVLTARASPAPGRLLRAKRLAAARLVLGADVAARSKLRKISLVRLERAVHRKLAAGEQPDDVMRHMAGLQRIKYVFCYPDAGDIVVAGPAEGWVKDSSGCSVGMRSLRPVILLEDLTVALRAYPPGSRRERFIGCTINPQREGLTRLVSFQRTIPSVVPQRGRDRIAAGIARGMRDSLGMAEIEVFGVSNKTHFAQVLIAADYRMKRIGTGLEPPPVKMVTFLSELRGARHKTLQRWWFVPDYECVKVTDDRLGMELVGQGVQLLGEDKLIGSDGTLIVSRAKPDKASQRFTLAFTRKFPEIAAASPIYAQLRNIIDLAVTAAFIRREDFYGRTRTSLGVLGDESQLPTEVYREPRSAACAVNSIWKRNRLFTVAGGGVSIQADEALTEARLLADDEGALSQVYRKVREVSAADRWWWD